MTAELAVDAAAGGDAEDRLPQRRPERTGERSPEVARWLERRPTLRRPFADGYQPRHRAEPQD